MKALTQLQHGQTGKISWLVRQGASQLKNRSICPGSMVYILQNLHGSMIIHCNGKIYAMNSEIAFGIKVEMVS